MNHQQLLDSSENFVVVGQAGSGKTTLLKNFLANESRKYLVVSAIALAAYNCGGQTIHALFKIPPFDEIYDLNDFVDTKKIDVDQFEGVYGVIFDEISSIPSKLFCMVNLFLKKIFKSDRPFGGRRVLLFGDFYQLPPVLNSNNSLFEYDGKQYLNGYIFNTDEWQQLNLKVIHLKTNHRQAQDVGLFDCLQNCRVANMTNADVRLLFSRVCSASYIAWAHLDPTYVFGKNQIVNKINEAQYSKNCNPEIVFKAKIWPKNISQTENLLANFSLVPQKLCLKLGTLVMVRKNIITCEQEKVSNGTRGIVVNLDQESATVELYDKRIVNIQPVAFDLPFSGTNVKIIQLPLCHAYAFTIHKLQGTTVEGPLCMDLGYEGIFLPFQAYVAASRIKTREHMYLLDLEPSSFSVDLRVSSSVIAEPPETQQRQSDRFNSWETFFDAPFKHILLSENCCISEETNFRLDAKSWIKICRDQPDKAWQVEAAPDLSIQATSMLRKNKCDHTVPSWFISVDNNKKMCVKKSDGQEIFVYFTGNFYVHFLGFTLFLGRRIGVTNK